MAAINFFWNCSKMVNGKAYDFVFAQRGRIERHECTCTRNGKDFTVTRGDNSVTCAIFRDGATVLDMLGLCIKHAGRVTSGEVYKADLLQWTDTNYESVNNYAVGIAAPSHEDGHNLPYRACSYYYGIELEVSARNSDCFTAMERIESNIIRKVSDCSIEGSGVEFVTGAFIAPEDGIRPEFWMPLCDMLTGLAKSKTCDSTGLHVHVSRTAFGETEAERLETIAKCIYIENYLLNENHLTAVFGRARSDRWSSRNRTKTTYTDSLRIVTSRSEAARHIMNDSDIREALVDDLTPYNAIRRGHNYPSERYQRINITNANTVEFRQGKGDINSKSIARIIMHVDTLIKYAKTTKWSALSGAGYVRSIPSSNKYTVLRDCFAGND